jgi:hypothetical protein
VDVLAALGEYDAARCNAKLRAGTALRRMTDVQGLSLRASRLVRRAADHP